MYGLNVDYTSSIALFIKQQGAENAARKLAFCANKYLRLRVSQKFSRGAFQGWTVTMQGIDGEHTITDGDVERFGL